MKTIEIQQHILASNEEAGKTNHNLFQQHHIYVPNLMGAPGCGKTTLLEKSLALLKDEYRIGVIEGDITTDRDKERIEKLGIPAYQIHTDGACHLEASWIYKSLTYFDLHQLDMLVIENIGNLVCPAEFYVGETEKIMLLSITEGSDKPKKYPLMFHETNALVIHKIDLLPYLDIDISVIENEALEINPKLEIFKVSSKTGEGMNDWLNFLKNRIRIARS